MRTIQRASECLCNTGRISSFYSVDSRGVHTARVQSSVAGRCCSATCVLQHTATCCRRLQTDTTQVFNVFNNDTCKVKDNETLIL